MEEWKEYRLGEIMEFNPKRNLRKNTIARKITMDKLVPHSRDIYDWTYEPYSGGAKFQNGDTLMARITPCLENGKQAYVSLLNEGETAFGSTEYIVICGRKGLCVNRFAYYLSLCPTFRNAAIKSMVGTSGRQRAQVDVLENMVMRLPPVPVQLNIVHILSSLDDKIELNRKINSNLEEQAKALFKSWFIDFEPFKGGKFVDSELGKIPEGWEVTTIGDVTENIKEKVGNRNDIKVLSPITSGQLVLSEDYFSKQVFSNSIAKYIVVKHNDFAYNPARINIGSIGMSEFDFDGCVSPVYVVFRCQKGYEYFFDLYRRTIFFTEEVKKRAIGGVRQTLSYKDLSFIQLVYPPKKVIDAFNSIYISLIHTIHSNNASNKKLEAIRDSLLPKLMSGEIEVK